MMLTLRNTVYMMKIGVATFLTETAMSVMMITGNYMFMSRLGEQGVAAFSIACYLFPVVFSIASAVAQSAQPIISFNYGANKSVRVMQTLKVAGMTALICGTAVTAGLSIGAKGIVSAFLTSDEPAYGIAVNGLPLFSVCSIFFAINVTFIGYYQSLERAGISILYTLLRGIVFLVPSFVLLPSLIGNTGLWLAIPTAEFLTVLIIIAHFLPSYCRNTPSQH